jgi:hypothetical protein
MQIDLSKIGTVKSSEITISDNAFDGKNVIRPDFGIEFVGTGTRNLVFRNLRGTESNPVHIIFKDTVHNHSGTTNVLKFAGGCQHILLDFGNSKFYGSGNNQSQMLFIEGAWNKGFRINGGYFNQGRNSVKGTTGGGSLFQIASSQTTECNKNNHDFEYLIVTGLQGENACDEFMYINKYTSKPENGIYPTGCEYVQLVKCGVKKTGRDFFQGQGIKDWYLEECYGEVGGLEQEPNHISAISSNGANEFVSIGHCNFKTIPQLMFGATEGKPGKVVVTGTNYQQGVNAIVSNQAVYLRSDKVLYEAEFKECNIEAPNVKAGVFMADGAKINVYKDCEIVGPKLFRDPFNGGSYSEITPEPIVEKETAQIEVVRTTEWGQATTTQYFLGSQELIEKP